MTEDAINRGVIELATDEHFSEAALTEWLKAEVEGFEGKLTVCRFKGGQSNPTYRLSTPGAEYVLRRKPVGELASGAHAVDREARVMSALARADFPVPRIYGYCADTSVIGSEFYIMQCVAGRAIWDAAMPEVPAGQRPAHFSAMNATIAALHMIDPDAVGLADFGKKGNYLERQIARWARQYQQDLPVAGREASLEKMLDWLPKNIPSANQTTIVHGDFRCDNMIFAADSPAIAAVLDWELSTLGDPLVDFCFHLMMYRMPPMVVTGLVGTDLAAANIPDEQAYVAEYCARTGRSGIAPSDLDYYIAFNMFRLAVIMHGIKARMMRGTASSGHADMMVQNLTPLANLACGQAGIA